MFYSRFSFMESGKDALDIKKKLYKSEQASAKKKFFTRSALVKNLIPQPSEGKVRAMFGEYR